MLRLGRECRRIECLAVQGIVIVSCSAFCSPIANLPVREAIDFQSKSLCKSWPGLFGPTGDSRIEGGRLCLTWNADGPPLVWRRRVGGGYSSPIADSENVVVSQRLDDQECIECLSVRTGATRWQYRYPTRFVSQTGYSNGPYSTPVMDSERIYTLGAEGVLTALTIENGRVVWQRNLGHDYNAAAGPFPIGTSPLLEEDLLIVAIGGRTETCGIVALDRLTGKLIWSATNDARGYGSPVAATIHGLRHAFVLTQESLVSLDPASGEVRWQIPFRPKNPETITAATPVVWKDVVFVGAYQVGAMAVRILPDGSYKRIWSHRRSLESQHNNLVCREGTILGFSARDNSLCCIDILTGESLWKSNSELTRGSLIAIDHSLLVWGESGHLVTLKLAATGCQTVAHSQPLLKSPCFSTPAITGGRLFLRNETELACFDLQ